MCFSCVLHNTHSAVCLSADVVIPVKASLCGGVWLYKDGAVKVVCIDDTSEVIAAPGSRAVPAFPGGVIPVAVAALAVRADPAGVHELPA